MIKKRASEERGSTEIEWLHAKHSFSFGNYYDPENTHFRTLRVINEDKVDAGKGFPSHPHRNMEIITYVMAGELQHKDSMGNGSVVHPFEAQYMSAGKGVIHSEFNPSSTDALKLFQIWIEPKQSGLNPAYAQGKYDPRQNPNTLLLVASPDGADGSILIQQDAWFSVVQLKGDAELAISLNRAAYAWVQVASGSIVVNGLSLERGDAASVSEEKQLTIRASEESFLLLFELT